MDKRAYRFPCDLGACDGWVRIEAAGRDELFDAITAHMDTHFPHLAQEEPCKI